MDMKKAPDFLFGRFFYCMFNCLMAQGLDSVLNKEFPETFLMGEKINPLAFISLIAVKDEKLTISDNLRTASLNLREVKAEGSYEVGDTTFKVGTGSKESYFSVKIEDVTLIAKRDTHGNWSFVKK
ncbi:hypothetical protein ACO0K9_20825 [Undibacterium sp. Ji50W]|uniref:hypothetical protein n=1 Tax=Undibacterium sp. Ji50W TaxID=3413041 RepID=UPI003BF3B536